MSGTQSQIPQRGDYFLFNIAGESVIVVRDGEGQINALLNVCRHRGSRICDEATGRASRLVCRYHGWTYGLDGSLRAAGHTPAEFDKSKLGLRRLHARVFVGLIFINFDAAPAPFEAIAMIWLRPWLRTLWSAARSHTAKTIPSPVTGSSPLRTIASAITARRHIRNIPLDTGARFLVRNRQPCSLK